MINLSCNPVWDFKVILAGSRRMMQTNVGEIRKMKYVLTNPDNSDEFGYCYHIAKRHHNHINNIEMWCGLSTNPIILRNSGRFL